MSGSVINSYLPASNVLFFTGEPPYLWFYLHGLSYPRSTVFRKQKVSRCLKLGHKASVIHLISSPHVGI